MSESRAVSRHTPGPWHIGTTADGWAERTCLSIIAENPGPNNKSHGMSRIAEVFRENYINREANASLIAASPELLASVKDLLEQHRDTCAINKRGDVCIVTREAEAAIAKAEGRES